MWWGHIYAMGTLGLLLWTWVREGRSLSPKMDCVLSLVAWFLMAAVIYKYNQLELVETAVGATIWGGINWWLIRKHKKKLHWIVPAYLFLASIAMLVWTAIMSFESVQNSFAHAAYTYKMVKNTIFLSALGVVYTYWSTPMKQLVGRLTA